MSVTYINYISAVFAFIAGTFWFGSALVKTPKEITTGYGGVGGSVQDLGDAIRKQSRLSAFGATAAASAAQGLALWIS